MSEKNQKCLELFIELERSRSVVERFEAFGSSSWVLLKNVIFELVLDYQTISKTKGSYLLSLTTIRVIFMSLWNYLVRIIRFSPQDLFVGAGSGVISYNEEIIDSYLPAELSSTLGKPADQTLYLLSANHVSTMWAQRGYLRRHRAVVYSFLVAPLRLVLAWLLAYFLPLNRRLAMAAKELSVRLANISIDISPEQILRLHARFCAGYLLYRLLLLPLRIRRAFVVSAYSNSELCAVLRRMGVEIVEVQHGLIGPMHRGYNYVTHSPLLPTPDKVYVYNDFWRDELVNAGYFSSENVIISERSKYTLAHLDSHKLNFKYVLFTGQGIFPEKVREFMLEFVLAGKDIHLVYVPHPNETEKYLSIIKSGFECNNFFHLIKSGEITTERLILDCIAHVSIYSSCHFDAVHFKGKTYILDVFNGNVMDYYVDMHPNKYLRIRNATSLFSMLDKIG